MENTDYLSTAEVLAAQSLHRKAPYSITNTSSTIFSLARHYGSIKYQGYWYVYIPEHDECVRDDVLKMVKKIRRDAKKAAQGKAPVTRCMFGDIA